MRLLIIILVFFCFHSFAQQPKLILPVGHTHQVWYAEFSPDGKTFVTASRDYSAKIWDVNTGNLLVDLIGHTNTLQSASFSPNGNKIVTASWDNTAKVWDAKTGIQIFDLKGHQGPVSSAVFSPDGKRIVTVSWDSTAKIWDAFTGKLIADLNKHSSFVRSAQFSLDGKNIITASDDNTAKIWDVISGALLAELKTPGKRAINALFCPDGKKILTASTDLVKIWDANTHLPLYDLKCETSKLWSIQFSGDGGKIITVSGNNAKLWDSHDGTLLADLKGHSESINSVQFSNDGSRIVSSSFDNTAKIWDVVTGKLLRDLKMHTGQVNYAEFSRDGKKIVTASDDSTAKIWDVKSGVMLAECSKHTYKENSEEFSPDGKKIVSTYRNNSVKIWDVETSTVLLELKGHTDYVYSANFSKDSKKIITTSRDGTAKIWDASTGMMLGNLLGDTDYVNSAKFSPDEKKIITVSSDHTVKIWDATTYSLTRTLTTKSGYGKALFSPNGNYIAADEGESGNVKIWDTKTYKLLFVLQGVGDYILSIQFNKDESKIAIRSSDDTTRIWDTRTGLIQSKSIFFGYFEFSPDGEKIITSSGINIIIWDAVTGRVINNYIGNSSMINTFRFSPDNKYFVTSSDDQIVRIWDISNGDLLFALQRQPSSICLAQFSPDSKSILTFSEDNTSKIWNASTGTLLYTFFGVDKDDYLTVDGANHYDGTEAARKLIYFSCGNEIISLDQVKDKLWVPNLAKRINKGEIINSAGIADLNICNLVPLIERIQNKTGYQFKITPQRGGIGSTSLFVNNIETKKYELKDLKKLPDSYELYVSKEELTPYFGSGSSNKVTVRSYTSENDIASRSGDPTDGEDDEKIIDTSAVNLFAVFIGVSEYKGKGLTLKFAAKDAVDLSNAVNLSSSKFLGKDHVLIYNLNTSETRDNIPEKKSIREAFTDIGKKATANDILMIFFAGHGVLEGENKQLYLLTADASTSSTTPNGVKEVGISAAELMDWIKPLNIKTQKRILILDACHSGSAINDIVSLGKDQGFAVRNDDKAEEIKQIDKLNEKSGMYVLAASASNQGAYEMGKYSQGILTYSLLKSLKEHPEILEHSKFLNVSGWFNSAVKIANDIARENKKDQEPQLVTMTNFNIGIIDHDVLSKIILPGERPLFVASGFQNDKDYDEFEIAKAVNNQLNYVSTRGGDGAISYISVSDSPEAYIINGRYSTKEDVVTIKINIVQSKEKVPKYRFQIVGKKSNIKALAETIVAKAAGSITRGK